MFSRQSLHPSSKVLGKINNTINKQQRRPLNEDHGISRRVHRRRQRFLAPCVMLLSALLLSAFSLLWARNLITHVEINRASENYQQINELSSIISDNLHFGDYPPEGNGVDREGEKTNGALDLEPVAWTTNRNGKRGSQMVDAMHSIGPDGSHLLLSDRLPVAPRIVAFDAKEPSTLRRIEEHVFKDATDRTKRQIQMSKRSAQMQRRLSNSKDYYTRKILRDPLYEGECVPMQPWQETQFPSCNDIHELDFLAKVRGDDLGRKAMEFLDQGGYNDIFWLWDDSGRSYITAPDKVHGGFNEDEFVMKILQYGTEYTDRNFDRVRRDALILERLTSSRYVLPIYGFCGFAVLVPYAGEGTLSGVIRSWRKGKLDLSSTPQASKERLKYAVQAAQGLADAHDIDGEGLSSVAHGDLKMSQYLVRDNGAKIQLGDFNRGRFLRRNSTAPSSACTYTIGKNDAKFRSPEEYKYLPETSAIDVWAMGSILYAILTSQEVWKDEENEDANQKVIDGKLPRIDKKILNSKDPVNIILRKAIDMCYVYDPKQRASAQEVAQYLKKSWEELNATDNLV